MSLIGSKCNFELYEGKVVVGIAIEKYHGLTKKTHTGPWPGGGRGDFESYFQEDYYIVEVDEKDYQRYYHLPCSSFKSRLVMKTPTAVNS